MAAANVSRQQEYVLCRWGRGLICCRIRIDSLRSKIPQEAQTREFSLIGNSKLKIENFKYYFAAFIILVLHQAAFACPVCYGASDAKTTEANNAAIIFLLSVTGVVLLAFGVFFIYMWRRIRKHREELSHAALVSEHGNLILNNEEGVTEEWNNI